MRWRGQLMVGGFQHEQSPAACIPSESHKPAIQDLRHTARLLQFGKVSPDCKCMLALSTDMHRAFCCLFNTEGNVQERQTEANSLTMHLHNLFLIILIECTEPC
ncbi:hypothetical protein SKAU_G00162360 [Synaphobranchus kaupii]|uniref:Uncharacterized protein n=1 Tax=Synaphobranchus kaupii TaxID=118154 RepID=A0A9Q1FIW7_SYNKA|nr:hypothetical protein SKAU_G00162360 [Synaphobranchus kaupii]